MAIREAYKHYDIHTCIHALLNGYSTAPWDDWTVKIGWPDVEISGDFSPTIYVLEPIKTDDIEMFCGGKPLNRWQMIVGFWLLRDDGGYDEMSIWVSQMLYKFQDRAGIHAETFDVTLGTTSYENTTLKAQKIAIDGIAGPSVDMAEDKNQIRKEMTLFLHG